jgi:sugar/nucleoside kinase (ribokinase family)
MFDLVVAGEINPDLVLTGEVRPEFGQVEKLIDSAALTVGSSSAIFACGAARLGLNVAFVGVCGDDVFGRFMIEQLQRRNVDVRNVAIRPNDRTGLSVILNRQADRAILTYPGLIPALRAEQVTDDLLRRSRHLHLASYFLQTELQPRAAGLFARARSLGLTTSLDTNYDPAEQWLGLEDILPHTSVFLPNRTEALAITHAADEETAARQLAANAGLVVIKLGPHGALACRGEQISRAESLAVQITDSIGAGDSFDAGFLFGYLSHWPLAKSLQLACVCGSLSMLQAGGTDGQPTLDEAMKHVTG